MQEELNLKVSQFIDNDLPVEEALELLDGIEEHQDLKNKLHRYEAIRQAIKTDLFIQVDEGFVRQINQQIQQENVHFLPCKRRIGQNYKTLIAIAASLAIVAVIIIGGLSQSTHNNINELQMIAQDEQSVGQQWADSSSATQLQRENPRYYDYLEAHQGSLYVSGLPFQHHSRVASYGQE
jgi:sigma-E factor negative regulatory protein RseA